MFDNFCGINTSNVADFKLPMILQSTYKIPGYLTISESGYTWLLYTPRLKI